MRSRVLALATLLASLSLPVALGAPAHAAPAVAPASASDIRISEVGPNGKSGNTYTADFIELTNLGTQDEDVSGWVLRDDVDTDTFTIPSGSVIHAGGYLAFTKGSSASTFSFGLGSPADAARLYEADGTTLVDEIYWNAANSAATGTWTRCLAGAGVYDVMDEPATPGAANSCPGAAAVTADLQAHVHVNEAMASEAAGASAPNNADWIEVDNTGPATVDLSGYYLSDDKATDKDVLLPGTFLDPDSLYGGGPDADPAADLHPYRFWNVGDASTTRFASGSVDFGLGSGGDNAALVFPDGSDVDRLVFGTDDGTKPAGNTSTVAAPAAGGTTARKPDGTGPFTSTSTPTPAAPNSFGNPADSTVTITDSGENGTVTLVNSASVAADVSGWVLSDVAGQTFTIPASTTVPAGGSLAVTTTLTPSATKDTITLKDGTTVVATTAWDNSAPTGQAAIRVNEVETNGDENGDAVELTNISSDPVDVGGMVFDDNHAFPASNMYTLPAGTVIAPGGFYVIQLADADVDGGAIGLGAADQAKIYPTGSTTSSATPVDAVTWTQHEAEATYDRCPGAAPDNPSTVSDSHGDVFINSWKSTLGSANVCIPSVSINEVEASEPAGDTYQGSTIVNDWVELTNFGAYPVNVAGWVISDDGNGDGDVVSATTPTLAGSLDADGNLAPGSYVAYSVDSATAFPAPSTASGLGAKATGDEVRLYESGGWVGYDGTNPGTSYDQSKLVDAVAWGSDQTGQVNGVTAGPSTVTGTWPVDPNGAAVTIGRCANGTSRIVANGTGAWAITASQTPGAANQCTGLVTPRQWPDSHDGQAVTTADSVDLGGNMSGLFYVAGATPAQDYMWGIENGTSGLAGANPGDGGELFKLVQDAGTGLWGPAAGWEKGVPVRYLDNPTGEIDSEGVTAVHGDVFVTSERDNTQSDVSKIAVVQVDPTQVTHAGNAANDADGDLDAVHEWDLGSDLGPGGTQNTGLDASKPGDANLGLEGLAFVPDSALTSEGFVDQSTGAAYDPASYPNHVDGGLFFAALEKNGNLYAYALNKDNTFHLVATVPTGFPTIMDVTWDPSQDALWATCDNSCQGESSILKVDQTAGSSTLGSFQIAAVNQRPSGAVTNLNNEGFTVQPASECVDGSRSAWWSDDSDDVEASDGKAHWLRTAHVDCTTPISGQTGASVTAQVLQQGTTTPAAPSASGWYDTPLTVAFTCTDHDAVLNQACPAPVDVSTSQPATTVATLSDTLGRSYAATVPALDIDTTPPSAANITIDGPSGTIDDADPSFTFTSSDGDVVGFTCRLDGVDAAFAPCTTGYTANGLADGTYTLEVESVDHAGNLSTPATREFTVALTHPFVSTPRPTISGTAKVGKTLTAHPGTWAPVDDGIHFAYQWYAGGRPIAGAHAATLSLKPTQQGKAVSVQVTGSQTGFDPATETSATTARVAKGTLSTAKPHITGTARVGHVLHARPGTWGPGPVRLTYRWFRNGHAIAGATHRTLKVTHRLLGDRLTVKVKGVEAGYTSATRASAGVRAKRR